MKNLMILLTIVTSGIFAFATPVDKTPVVASVKTIYGFESGIQEVALLLDGRLQIKNENGTVTQIALSEVATADLMNSVQLLSDIEVKVERRSRVCKMVPRPELSDLAIASYDSVNDKYSKDRKLILTSRQCSFSKWIYPADPNAMLVAAELRKALVILALNSVK